MLTIDTLSQEIRRVDGNHSLGAGALAEALMPLFSAALSEQTLPVRVEAGTVEYRWDGIAGKMRYFGSAAPNGWLGDKQPPSVTEQITDTVLSWMVKYDLLDAGNEYQAADVLAVLNDLVPACHSLSVEKLKWMAGDHRYGPVSITIFADAPAEALAATRNTKGGE